MKTKLTKIFESSLSYVIKSFLIFFILININYIYKANAQVPLPVAEITSPAQLSIISSNALSNFAGQVNTFATQISNYQLFTKEFILDVLAKATARAILKNIEASTIQWINSGFKGKPLFIQNPNLFFKGVAVNQLLLAKNKILGDIKSGVTSATNQLRAANKETAKYVINSIANKANNEKKALIPTTGPIMCTNIKNEMDAIIDKKSLAFKLKEQSYKDFCTKNTKGEYDYKKIQQCAANFSCGGWGAILAVTQNPEQNTVAGRSAAALAQVQDAIKKEEDDVKAQQQASGGYIDQGKCVRYQEVGDSEQICAEYEKVNLGSSARTAVDQTLRSPSLSNIAADEISEVVVNISEAFVSKIINTGIGYVAGLTNKISSDIDKQIDALGKSAGVKIDSVGGQIAGTNPSNIPTLTTNSGNTGSSSGSGTGNNQTPTDSGFTLEPGAKSAIINISKIKTDTALSQNRKELVFLIKEIEKYQELRTSISELKACYLGKSPAQQMSVVMTSREGEIISIITSLSVIRSDAERAAEMVTAKQREIETTNDPLVLANSSLDIDKIIKESKLLTSNTRELRDFESSRSGGLYAALARELEEIKRQVLICNGGAAANGSGVSSGSLSAGARFGSGSTLAFSESLLIRSSDGVFGSLAGPEYTTEILGKTRCFSLNTDGTHYKDPSGSDITIPCGTNSGRYYTLDEVPPVSWVIGAVDKRQITRQPLNGFNIDPSVYCSPTVPPIQNAFYHNINFPAQRLENSGTRQVYRMNPNQAMVFGIRTPILGPSDYHGGIFKFDVSEPDGPQASSFITISKNPCDFDQSNVFQLYDRNLGPGSSGGSRNTGNPCYQQRDGTQGSLIYRIGPVPDSGEVSNPSRCILEPGQQYYINIRWQSYSNPTLDDCKEVTAQNPKPCALLFNIR